MRAYDEVVADARPGRAFATGTEFDVWATDWCYAPCAHEPDCPLIAVALLHEPRVTPAEWEPGDSSVDWPTAYTCTEFTPEPPA